MLSSPSQKTPSVTNGNSSRWPGLSEGLVKLRDAGRCRLGPPASWSTASDHLLRHSKARNQPSLDSVFRCKAVHGTKSAVPFPTSLHTYEDVTRTRCSFP